MKMTIFYILRCRACIVAQTRREARGYLPNTLSEDFRVRGAQAVA